MKLCNADSFARLKILNKTDQTAQLTFDFMFLVYGAPLELLSPFDLRNTLVHEKQHLIDFLTILHFKNAPWDGIVVDFETAALLNYFKEPEKPYGYLEYRARLSMKNHIYTHNDNLSLSYKDGVNTSFQTAKVTFESDLTRNEKVREITGLID